MKLKGFGAAWNLFRKKVEKLQSIPTAQRRLDVLTGASDGLDAHLLTVITGPKAKQYNGSRGEDGIQAHRDAAEAWVQFLKRDHTSLSLEDCKRAFAEVWKERPTEAYGFDRYGSDDFMKYYIYKRTPFADALSQFDDEKKAAWEEAQR